MGSPRGGRGREPASRDTDTSQFTGKREDLAERAQSPGYEHEHEHGTMRHLWGAQCADVFEHHFLAFF